MGRFVGIWIVLCAACGRIGFDPGSDGRLGGDDGPPPDSGFTPGGVTSLTASNAQAGDAFGASVAVSHDGSTLAVGAHDEDSSATGVDGNQADEMSPGSGAAYVYTRQGGTWMQQAYIKASNTGPVDGFGTQVALSADGNTLAVSAYLEDSSATGIGGTQLDNSGTDSGAVYVFTRTGTTWTQEAYVKQSVNGANDHFGQSVTLSADGNVLAVGANGEGSIATGVGGNQIDDSAPNSGAAYVFTRAGATWSQVAYIKASNTGVGDYFGETVSLSADGTTLAVGAYLEASNAFGVDGDQTNNSELGAGAVYVFGGGPASWSQQAYVKAINSFSGDEFGIAVALSGTGDVLAVGAKLEDSSATGIGGDPFNDSGIVTRLGATWSHANYIKATNPGPGDNFSTPAISGDASTFAIGAPGAASLAGAVYVFD